VKASLLGTTARSDGSHDRTGLDQFGAEWYVLSPAGRKVEG
jgi:hypothetical protein